MHTFQSDPDELGHSLLINLMVKLDPDVQFEECSPVCMEAKAIDYLDKVTAPN